METGRTDSNTPEVLNLTPRPCNDNKLNSAGIESNIIITRLHNLKKKLDVKSGAEEGDWAID
jgi:hypothetical protein